MKDRQSSSALEPLLQVIPPPDGTMLRLTRNMGLLWQIMGPFFAQFGVSSPQWGILKILQRAEDHAEKALSQKEISRRMLIQPPSVTALVNRLERMGLLQRSSTEDLRVRMVALTDAGRNLVLGIEQRHSALIASLFSGLTSSELESFHGLLGKWGAHLASIPGGTHLPTALSSNPVKVRPQSLRFPSEK